MSPSLETATRLAPDPLPDLDAWMPSMDGVAPPEAPAIVGRDWYPAPADAASSDPAAPGPVATAATALAAGLGIDGPAGARRLTGPAGATLMVDPELHLYYFESTRLLPLAALLSLPAPAWTPVYSKSLAETRGSSPGQPLVRLRWFAGLVASPGVLNPALDRHARFQLGSWQAIEREFPRHFRIAKQFFGHAVTIDAAATAAGATLEEVIDYVNAGIASRHLQAVA